VRLLNLLAQPLTSLAMAFLSHSQFVLTSSLPTGVTLLIGMVEGRNLGKDNKPVECS